MNSQKEIEFGRLLFLGSGSSTAPARFAHDDFQAFSPRQAYANEDRHSYAHQRCRYRSLVGCDGCFAMTNCLTFEQITRRLHELAKRFTTNALEIGALLIAAKERLAAERLLPRSRRIMVALATACPGKHAGGGRPSPRIYRRDASGGRRP